MASAVPQPPAPIMAMVEFMKCRSLNLGCLNQAYSKNSLSFSYTAPEGFNVLLKTNTRSTTKEPNVVILIFRRGGNQRAIDARVFARASVI